MENQTPGIYTIPLHMPLGMGSVNCYLLAVPKGFILVDTGGSNARSLLEKKLEAAGCLPGDLKMVILTHGDFDHTGNAAYLKAKYGAMLAMHAGDRGMAEQGNMFYNRSKSNTVIKVLMPLVSGFGASKRFTPDLFLEDGFDFTPHGLDARIISIPGHSLGSIGIFTTQGEFFCGDLLENLHQPRLNSLMDNPAAGAASLKKILALPIHFIYPGHGASFTPHDL